MLRILYISQQNLDPAAGTASKNQLPQMPQMQSMMQMLNPNLHPMQQQMLQPMQQQLNKMMLTMANPTMTANPQQMQQLQQMHQQLQQMLNTSQNINLQQAGPQINFQNPPTRAQAVPQNPHPSFGHLPFKRETPSGQFHDQGDAKWIVIRGQLRGHNDTPFEWPTPVRPIGRQVVGRPQGVVGVCRRMYKRLCRSVGPSVGHFECIFLSRL
jgi:hypothetical protein